MPTAAETFPSYRAQLATLVDHPPTGPQWLHELKYDGYRIGCHIQGGRVRLQSRRQNDWTRKFPEVVAAAVQLPVQAALLDGEVAIVLPNGKTSFQALQNSFTGGAREGLVYFVFEILHLDGRNLAALPLEARKRQCADLLHRAEGAPRVLRYWEHFEVDGAAFFERACALGAEGIVSKRRDTRPIVLEGTTAG